ncbi:hypothetical protein [uncultured Oscillibacter sp.]|uniref:hypothetical protein n=1 Tax=uncultured Oscillibacter sp. TaxID=876091 RepID=UPI0026379821|nr:hypothetical protein [uncultured Oscillibacter sp.]
MKGALKKEKAADFVIGYKICCLLWYIERRVGVLLGTKRLAFLKRDLEPLVDKVQSCGIPRLKGRVLPGQGALDQLNATDFEVHNIAPSPQSYGRHTRQQELHFNIIVKTAVCCLCHKY